VGQVVARQPHCPTITADLAEWSVQHVRTHGDAFMASAVANIADSDYHWQSATL
jgi:hypothetical protein